MKRDLTDFFTLLVNHKLKEAEEYLNELAKELNASKEDKGFLKALEGLVLALKSQEDRYLYAPMLLSSKKLIENARVEFQEHCRNPLHDPYDRGYFKAMAEFTEFLWKTQYEGKG
ncbi:MAG: hypothetical protein QXO32_03190 [Candidatus Bathyarchaeia archaeon]